MKLCVDCDYYRKDVLDDQFSMCAFDPSPVNGQPHNFCSIERNNYRCGAVGRNYKPRFSPVAEVVQPPERKTFWAKIFN